METAINQVQEKHVGNRQGPFWRRTPRARSAVVLGSILLAIAIMAPGPPPAPDKSLAAQVAALDARVDVLEKLLADLSRNGDGDLVLSGANFYLQSGAGATEAAVNGKGNLIVGYDEDDGTDVKSGSHNLVVGALHSYASYGGFVAGQNNSILAPSASVSGGGANVADGERSSVSGGAVNTASGNASSVNGGLANQAGEVYSAVGGGSQNLAMGMYASICGGFRNTATGEADSVTGGANNTASGGGSTVSGGNNRTAPALHNWAAGGLLENS